MIGVENSSVSGVMEEMKIQYRGNRMTKDTSRVIAYKPIRDSFLLICTDTSIPPIINPADDSHAAAAD